MEQFVDIPVPVQQEDVVQIPVELPQKRVIQQSVEQLIEVPVGSSGFWPCGCRVEVWLPFFGEEESVWGLLLHAVKCCEMVIYHGIYTMFDRSNSAKLPSGEVLGRDEGIGPLFLV